MSAAEPIPTNKEGEDLVVEKLSEPEFTPGPLVVWSSIYEGMVAEVRLADTGAIRGRAIAQVHKHPNGYRDALLYAAAPDLLAVAEMILKAQRMSGIDGPIGRAAREAIAKATGREALSQALRK